MADAPDEAQDRQPEPPGVSLRPVLGAAAGAVVLLLVGAGLLLAYYRVQVGATPPAEARAFPRPRLETSIDPRSMLAVTPGPAAPPLHVAPPRPAVMPVQAAMALVVGKGPRAYDPLIAAPPQQAAAGQPPPGARR